MNIFVSDKSPVICAQNLDDKRVKHMPKETLECLIMSVHKNYGVVIHPFLVWGDAYRRERWYELYTNPVTEWVARKRVNTWWTYRHLFALFDEFKFRFGQRHYLFDIALSISHYFKPVDAEPRTFANASGLTGSNIVELYKECLLKKWFVTDEMQPVTWTKRGAPSWVIVHRTEQGELFPKQKMDTYDSNNLGNYEFDDLPF